MQNRQNRRGAAKSPNFDPSPIIDSAAARVSFLVGSFGSRRPSVAAADYAPISISAPAANLPVPKKRSSDFSRNLKRRDRLLKKGKEAQWRIFDLTRLSVIYANRALRSRAAPDTEKETAYFNRSLGQITTGF
jgi:hypothetical protein